MKMNKLDQIIKVIKRKLSNSKYFNYKTIGLCILILGFGLTIWYGTNKVLGDKDTTETLNCQGEQLESAQNYHKIENDEIVNNKEKENIIDEDAFAREESEVKALVNEVHRELNESVCWGRSPSSFTYSKLEVLAEEIETLNKEILNITDSLKHDLTKLAESLKFGGSNRNREKIVEAHRIAHDLDCYYFESHVDAEENFWGVTKTLGKSK